MDIPIQDERFEGQGLAVRTAGFWSEARLVRNGTPLSPSDGRVMVRDRSGQPISIRLLPTWVDPVPKVEIEQETFELARPLTWFEYLWICLPMALVLAGGALGVLVGITAIYSSARIFRGRHSTISKYGLSALISVAALLVFLVLVGIVEILIADGPV